MQAVPSVFTCRAALVRRPSPARPGRTTISQRQPPRRPRDPRPHASETTRRRPKRSAYHRSPTGARESSDVGVRPHMSFTPVGPPAPRAQARRSAVASPAVSNTPRSPCEPADAITGTEPIRLDGRFSVETPAAPDAAAGCRQEPVPPSRSPSKPFRLEPAAVEGWRCHAPTRRTGHRLARQPRPAPQPPFPRPTPQATEGRDLPDHRRAVTSAPRDQTSSPR